MPRTEAPPPSAFFLRDLGSSAARISGDEDPSRELLRLGVDPLLLHAFLRRQNEPCLPAATRQRRELLLPVGITPRSAIQHSSRLFAYRMAMAPDPPSLRPEIFWPSDGDGLATPTGPQEQKPGRLRRFGIRVAMTAIALVPFVLVVLFV